MHYFTEPSECSLQNHIGFLEDLYAECFRDNADPATLTEIWDHIKKFRKKLGKQHDIDYIRTYYIVDPKNSDSIINLYNQNQDV